MRTSNHFKLLLVLLFLSITIQATLAQDADTKKLFDQGVIYYQNRLYKDAFTTFKSIESMTAPNPLITSTYLMLAKTAIKVGEEEKAASYIKYLRSAYPESKYNAHGYYLMGQIDFGKQCYVNAFENFSKAREFSTDDELTNLATAACDTLLSLGIDHKTLLNLYSSYPWQKNKTAFELWTAESYIRNGDRESANLILNQILSTQKDSKVIDKAQALKNLQYTPKLKIGVILPMSGYFSDEAKQLLRGMGLALEENKDVQNLIDLEIADSQGEQVGAVHTALDITQKDYSLLIGELEDNNSIAIAGLAARENIPIIVPVGTQNGVATIGDKTFQANNDLNTRGAALGEYAVNVLGMKTFATIAPADEYGHALTDAFTKKIDNLGGTIISQKWFYPGTTDLKRQLDAIREAGFRYAFRDSIEAMGLPVTQSRIDSIYNAMNEWAKDESTDNEGLIESTDIPVTSIDGFFLPVYEEELSIIAPQLALSNIVTTPLGGGYWLDKRLLRRQRNYLDGCVFVAGYYFSETDLRYKKFVNDYRLLTAASPGKLSVYGYNVMNLIIQAVREGNTTREEIVNFLDNVKDFDGIGGKITFYQSGHVNKAVNILQYKDGNISKIN